MAVASVVLSPITPVCEVPFLSHTDRFFDPDCSIFEFSIQIAITIPISSYPCVDPRVRLSGTSWEIQALVDIRVGFVVTTFFSITISFFAKLERIQERIGADRLGPSSVILFRGSERPKSAHWM